MSWSEFLQACFMSLYNLNLDDKSQRLISNYKHTIALRMVVPRLTHIHICKLLCPSQILALRQGRVFSYTNKCLYVDLQGSSSSTHFTTDRMDSCSQSHMSSIPAFSAKLSLFLICLLTNWNVLRLLHFDGLRCRLRRTLGIYRVGPVSSEHQLH